MPYDSSLEDAPTARLLRVERGGEVAGAHASNGTRLSRAAGVELIGEFEGSGFKETPYLVRRSDGQVVQLPRLLYTLVEAADGQRSHTQIAEVVGEAVQRRLQPDQIEYLAGEKLRPLGLLEQVDGSSPAPSRTDPLLALKLRTAVVPPRAVNALTKIFRPLFLPPVVVAMLVGLVAVDAWVFFVHGIAQSLRSALYNPAFLLLVLGLVVLSAAFHETGHATACAYGGAKPGAMGVGLYIVWPAFYTDVTDAYRLGKGGRLRTDLGGVYFNVIFVLATFGAYLLTGFEPLLLLIPLQHVEMLHQFLPFVRLDGYYIVSDLTGVPDMFSRIGPTLRSLAPWRESEDSVKALKPWTRVVVTVYVLLVVPVLLLVLFLTAINTPRILATAWDSFWTYADQLGRGSPFASAFTAFQMGILVLPVAGLLATFAMLGRRVGSGLWTLSDGRPALRGTLAVAGGAALAAVAYVLAPNGDYRPIQTAERGVLQAGLTELANIPSGRPALTAARARELAGAPSQRSLLASGGGGAAAATRSVPGAAPASAPASPAVGASPASSGTGSAAMSTDAGSTPLATAPANDATLASPPPTDAPGTLATAPAASDPSAPAAAQPAPAPAWTPGADRGGPAAASPWRGPPARGTTTPAPSTATSPTSTATTTSATTSSTSTQPAGTGTTTAPTTTTGATTTSPATTTASATTTSPTTTSTTTTSTTTTSATTTSPTTTTSPAKTP